MMARKPTAIFISGRGSNMEALIRAAQQSNYPAEIVTVVSNRPDAHGVETARSLGIETLCVDHSQFADRESFEQRIDRHCRDRDIAYIACAGFMRIMSDNFVNRWAERMLNIHPSLLPSYRGLETHERALADGVRVHGCTVHYVTSDLDAGPIIAQAAVPVLAEDTVQSLAQRVLRAEHQLYPIVFGWVAAGEVTMKEGKVHYGFETGGGCDPLFSPSAARR